MKLNLKVSIEKLKVKIFGRKLDPYWLQEVEFKKCQDRLQVFMPFINGKKVLHIGCTDYPIFNPKNNLHLKLANICSDLHGMDTDSNGIVELEKYFTGKYFTNLSQISEDYDTILIPETIEHVENIGLFLKEISSISAKNYIITGPNCFHDFFKNGYLKDGKFIEKVHPDHNCWFSPYTLKNVIQKYSLLQVDEIILSNNEIMIICICSKV